MVRRSCDGNKVCDKWRRRELLEEEFSQIVFGGWENQASEKKGSKRWVRKRTF